MSRLRLLVPAKWQKLLEDYPTPERLHTREAERDLSSESVQAIAQSTFAIEFEPFGKANTEPFEKRFLLGSGLGDAAQANLSPVACRQHDIRTL